jgi:threonine/homoserine/homoserine lactone efflux protein
LLPQATIAAGLTTQDVAMSMLNMGLFVLSAVALLGSPGPGIASLVAIGKTEGLASGLRFFGGLQIGLALVAAATAAGLLSLLTAVPGLAQIMSIVSAVYLIWLAWKIASAPVGEAMATTRVVSTFASGALLGLCNPKAYLAFASLFAMPAIIAGSRPSDSALKWALIVAVIIIVDLAWLAVGVRLRHLGLSPASERAINISLGLLILLAVVLVMLPGHITNRFVSG